MAKKKAKWLEETTIQGLLQIIKSGIEGDEKAEAKMSKAIDELIERLPDGDDTPATVEESIQKALDAVTEIQNSYKAELAAMDLEDEEDEEDEEGEEEVVETKKGKKKGKGKKVEEEPEEEDEEDEDDEDDSDDEADYTDMSQKELKALCRERGLKVNKSMKKSDFIKMLEADDKN